MHVVSQAVCSLYLGRVKAGVRYGRHRHVFKSCIHSKEKHYFHSFEMLLALDSLIYSYLISMEVLKQLDAC